MALSISRAVSDANSGHGKNLDIEDSEPLSKQLTILVERRQAEEKRKSRHHWSLLRDAIKNITEKVKVLDIRDTIINHGIHLQRKLNHTKNIKEAIFLEDKKEYLTLDGQEVHLFYEDGRRKESKILEEPMDHISYCSQTNQYVGWQTDGDEIFLMDETFEIISQSRAPSKIIVAGYNQNINEFVTVGPGYLVPWAFRYGARHLIPRKMCKTGFNENNCFSNMVLESTASRSQKLFLSCNTGIAVFNVFEGKLLAHKKNLHERAITAITFFNPLKYLVSGSVDGTIKVWDSKWHVKMVFVGHRNRVCALDIYPQGSAIISASLDCTIRVWNLDTCDEVDRAVLEEPVYALKTTLDIDIFHTFSGKQVHLWKLQHLYNLHTSVGHRVVKIKHTTHPNYSMRTVLVSRDASVRIITPSTGDIITTLLLDPARVLMDVAYSIEEETMFTLMGNGDILKIKTNTNPCQVVMEWSYKDRVEESCSYLLVYEYVVEISLKMDGWSTLKRGMATKSLKSGDGAVPTNCNRTLLFGGRKDGHICVFNWDTGEVDFKMDAHGSKGVVSMIANSKVDQLISAGKDNIIKVWRVYPFAHEALAPLMSFYCAHLPQHMTMIKTNLCVAFQDHSTATFSIVIYNLKDRNRFDHKPDDDHVDAITGLTSCPRMKLYASSSIDGTIRIWNEENILIRLLKIKTVPYSVDFCSSRGDLLVGIGNHLYKIPYHAYLPKIYIFKMLSMKFVDQKPEEPIPENQAALEKLSKRDLSRLKNSQASFKFSNFVDILSPEEEEEINHEKQIKEQAFNLLQTRDQQLCKIRDGDLELENRQKSTKETQLEAFTNYMKMYYDKPRPTLKKEDPFSEDMLKDKLQGTLKPEEKKEWMPEPEPIGFFPPASAAKKPNPKEPLNAPFPIRPGGLIPNSILVKLLWPPEVKKDLKAKRKKEWTLPSISLEQLAEISKSKQAVGEGEGKEVTFAEDGDFEERVLVMDDYKDDEDMQREITVTSPDQLTGILKKEKSKLSEESSVLSKFKEILDKSPSPKPAESPVTVESDKSQAKIPEKSTLSGKLPQPSQSSTIMKDLKAQKQPVKFAPRPPPEEKAKSPTQRPTAAPVAARAHTPSPLPPRPSTPLPQFITQFIGREWFDKFYPNCNESTLPKPWTLDNFVNMLLRLIRIGDYSEKASIVDALAMLHAQEEFSDALVHSVCKTISSVLNHHKDPPTCMRSDQKNFILSSLKTMQKLGLQDKDFFTELLVQFLDGDKEVRSTVLEILYQFSLHDPHHYLGKELDSWDIWNVQEEDRKADLKKMCQQWLDRWMTSYKLHLEDAIERMKKGQNLHGKLNKDSIRKPSILKKSDIGETISDNHDTTLRDGRGISRGVTVTFDKPPDPALIDGATYIDAMNYFCDMMMEKELDGLRHSGRKPAETKEKVVQAKNTVLIFPKLPHKPCLVRLGETHTSACQAHRETNLHVDYRLPTMTARGYHPLPGQLSGFVNSINLPMKSIILNPFPNELDEYDLRFQEPILIMLKSSQKYFIPEQSVVRPDMIAATAL
ncbi:hypothetical protein ACJMK2_010825 [Sinanodonta woodiana]|uniref:WD repeat-containing protein 97 n=1 Tax=Sinanodonta woodiana TaxID=1069815 RepID=A0ABD3VGP6_SINWO